MGRWHDTRRIRLSRQQEAGIQGVEQPLRLHICAAQEPAAAAAAVSAAAAEAGGRSTKSNRRGRTSDACLKPAAAAAAGRVLYMPIDHTGTCTLPV